ncbi:MAG: hypothetical protein NVS2B16_12370 [Chloroflexota bacterium]
MEFDNSFTVNAPLQQVWEFLLNVEDVAPCMPGAQLTEVVSETEYRGTVKVKLGAVQMSYKGTATIREIDETTHTVVLVASGRETRGTGNASSTTTSRLVEEDANHTLVNLHSQVDVSGRVAQFGRGIMQEVASRLIGEFARNLEAKLIEQDSSPSETGPSSPSDTPPLLSSTVTTAPPTGDQTADTSAEPSSTQTADASPAATTAIQTAPPVVAASVTSSSPEDPQPIKMLPIFMDIARSQMARGLRLLASIVEPKQRS